MSKLKEEIPTRFIKNLLPEIQCPVLIVPRHFQPVAAIKVLYNGEPSSVFAVKSFSYLLEPFKNLDIEVISVKAEEDSEHLPDGRLIKEFAKRHFPKVQYVVLRGNAEDELIHYLKRKSGSHIIVLGAYQRSKISRLFRPSMADLIMEHIKQPVFIAHK
jgi:nucleotide-binding universal stress UspA family protein